MRSRYVIKGEALFRLFMLRVFHKFSPLILVTEFPKSGASWLAQMLQSTTGFPFPRQQFPPMGKAIYHGHYIGIKSKGPVIVFWRDPRDIMVSWYYHTLHYSNKNHPEFVDMYRSALNFDDINNIKANLPKFIDFNFTTPLSPRFTFNDFFDYWYGRAGTIECRYESLIDDPVTTLFGICNQLGFEASIEKCASVAEEYSFKRLSDREPGKEDTGNYLRKGIVGDWKNYFTGTARQVFQERVGERLVRLGYEKDNKWVKGIASD